MQHSEFGPGRVLVFDPRTPGPGSHHLPVNASLLDDLGPNAVCFVSDSAAIEWLGSRAVPHVFATRERKNWIDRVLISAGFADWAEIRDRRDMKLLRRAVAASGIGPADAILIHSSTINNLAAVRLFIEQASPGSLPQFHIRTVYEGRNRQGHHAELRRLAALNGDDVSIRFYCETEEMQQHFRHHVPAARFDIWVTPISVEAAPSPPEKSDPGKVLRVGLLGGSRKGRGMERVFALARQLARCTAGRPGPPIEILAQHVPDERIAAEEDALGDRVSVVSLGGVLSAQAFREAIDRSHMLLLMHDLDPHVIQGSGIVIDALLSGTPWITREGLSMRFWRQAADQLEAGDDVGFSRSILKVGADYDRFRQGTLRARRTLIARHRERLAAITWPSTRRQRRRNENQC